MVTARLQAHVHRRAPHIETAPGRVIECLHFRMRLSGGLSSAFADNLIVLDDDAPNLGIGRSDKKPFGSPVQSVGHTLQIAGNFHVVLKKVTGEDIDSTVNPAGVQQVAVSVFELSPFMASGLNLI